MTIDPDAFTASLVDMIRNFDPELDLERERVVHDLDDDSPCSCAVCSMHDAVVTNLEGP